MQAKQTRELIHCFPWTSRSPAISRRAGPYHTYLMVTRENKHRHSKRPPLHPSSPHYIHWAWCSIAWDIPLVVGVTCPGCISSQLPQHPHPGVAAQEGLDSVRALLSNNKYLYIFNIVFSINLKHSPIWVTLKKINSIPAKTSTGCKSKIRGMQQGEVGIQTGGTVTARCGTMASERHIFQQARGKKHFLRVHWGCILTFRVYTWFWEQSNSS